MSRNVPARTAGSAPARVVHYVDPAPASDRDALLALANPLAYQAELARRRHEREVLYGRWLLRQQEIEAGDRKVRRFYLGFGAVLAVAILGALAAAGWFAFRALGDAADAVSAAPAGLVGLLLIGLVAAVLAGLGRRCITVIQHWHE